MKNKKSFEGLSFRISQAIRLSESGKSSYSLQKSTKSVEFNEIYSIADVIETADQDLNPRQTFTDILQNPPDQNLLEYYKKYFLAKKRGNKLLKYYCKETCKLIKSEIKHLDFSIKEVLLRLKSGYTIYKYGQRCKLRKYLTLIVEESVLKMKTKKKCYKIIPFSCLYGVIIGCETYDFKKNKAKIDKDCGIIHNDYNCFSILTETNTYDLACFSDQAFYDICLGLSWISYLYSEIPTSIPYSKYTLSLSVIRLKLDVIAKGKYMSVVELFLLAICKTLKEMGQSYEEVMRLLNKRFNYEAKIYRFVVRSIVNVVREQQSCNTLKTEVRISLMANEKKIKKGNLLKRASIFLENFKVPEISPFQFVAFFVPYSTSVFEKPKKEKQPEVLGRRRYTSILRHGSVLVNNPQ